MTTIYSTPPGHSIRVRNLYFNRSPEAHGRWWHGGDPVPTAFFNALSCTFPAGEKFFMDSVRHYKWHVGKELQGQIKDFVGQEAVHSREHAAFNGLAANAGYDVGRLEARTLSVLGRARKRPPIEQLAATCALEHFTAILAHGLLKRDGADLEGAPEDAVRLWTWHAMEEIEHKAVAYDTFLAATADWSGLRRYALRVEAMIAATIILFGTIYLNMRDLYREDGIAKPRILMRTLGYLLWKPGILRLVFRDYLAYFRPGFHPWQHDDRALLAKAEARIAVPVVAEAA